MANKKKMKQRNLFKKLFLLSVLVPLFTYEAIFWFFPMGFAFYMSLHNWGLYGKVHPFIGLVNYWKAINDSVFQIASINTVYLAFLLVVVVQVMSLLIALLLNKAGKMKTFYRLSFFVPAVSSSIGVALIWNWLYQPKFGIFNQVLKLLGLPQQFFLMSTGQVIPSIVAMILWGSGGFTVIIYLAGLQGIPNIFYEAAKIDGARRMKMLLHITLPLLRPTIVYTMVTGTITGFLIFDAIYILTKGGPVNSSTTLVYYIFGQAFQEFRLGYGCAITFILFCIILLLTILNLKVLQPRWKY